jgi:hypothetical protein
MIIDPASAPAPNASMKRMTAVTGALKFETFGTEGAANGK